MNIKNLKINSRTDVYCIFGNPVKHSLSPVMQNAAFKSAGIDAVYLAFEIDNIRDGVSAMKALKISGASVTIPFKRNVMEFVDIIDPLADDIGSVNTLHNVNGKITGYNTDGYGALDALKNNNINVRDSRALIIGNGGSARAIAFTLRAEGARITIAGRSMEKISALAADVKTKGSDVHHALIQDLSPDIIKNIDIIINTTPVGMTPATGESPLPERLIMPRHAVFDIVYSPDMTMLLKIAKARKCRIVRGIEMLVNQGARQFEIWTGKKAPVAVMKKAVKKRI